MVGFPLLTLRTLGDVSYPMCIAIPTYEITSSTNSEKNPLFKPIREVRRSLVIPQILNCSH
jgi:hypothetical protein